MTEDDRDMQGNDLDERPHVRLGGLWRTCVELTYQDSKSHRVHPDRTEKMIEPLLTASIG